MAKKPAANTSTKVMLLVVVALAATAFFLGRNPKSGGPNPDELIFPGFEPDAVTSITLERDGKTLIFKKEDPPEKASENGAAAEKADAADEAEERWLLVSPLEDQADGAALRQILTQMTWIAPVRKVSEELVAGLNIDPPAAVLTLERPGEDPLVIKLGASLPNKTYGLVIVGRDEGYQIKPSFRDKLLRPLSELRRRELFTLSFRDLDSLTIEARGQGQGLDGARRFTKEGGFWHIGAADGPYADQPELETLARAGLELQAAGVRDDESWTAEQIKAYQLDPPRLTIIAGAADRRQRLLIGSELAGSDGLRAARFDDRRAIYTVNPRGLLRALGRPRDRMRSRALAQIGGVPVEKVTVEAGGVKRALKLEGRDWQLEGSAEVKLDQARVKKAVDALRAAQALRFDDQAPALAAAPELVITIKAGPLERVLKVFAKGEGEAAHPIQRGDRAGLVFAALPSLPELRDPDLKLRDRRFYEHDPFNLVELELLDAKGERLRLLKKDGAELVEEGAEATTDPQRVQILTARLKALRADEYVARLSPEALKAYGLDAPERQLRLTLREWREDKEELVKRVLLFSAAGEDGRRHLVFEGIDAVIRPVKVPLVEIIEEGLARGAGSKKDNEDG